MAVKHRKWWKEMEPRRQLVRQKGRENDTEFLATLGGMEAYAWHEARKEVDPDHCNPYIMEDRRRYLAQQEKAR